MRSKILSSGLSKSWEIQRTARPAPREQGVTPHVAQNLKHSGGSAIDGRTTRHAGYALSQTIRKRIENLFGDGKQHRGLIRQLKVRRLRKASFVFAP